MTTLDELVVRIKADASQLEREMRRVQGITEQSAGRMQNSVGGLTAAFRGLLPALSVGALVAWGKSAVDAADRMNDLGQRIGFAASTLSALETPLRQSGASLEDFASAVNLMNANIGEAVVNLEGPAANAFSRLGLSVEQLKRLSPEEQFYAIADALGRVGTQFEQTELGRAVFGRGFATLLPLIKQANGDIKQTVETIGEMQSALGEDTLKTIDEFGDRMAAAGIKAKNEFLELYAVVARTLMFIDDAASQMSKGNAETGGFAANKIGIPPARAAAMQAYLDKARAGGFVTEASRGQFMYGEAFGPQPQAAPASGGGGGSPIKKSAEETRELSAATEAFLARAERAKAIYEQTRTPLEKHNEAVAEAKALYEEGLITLDTYARVQEELADTMDKTGESAVVNARIIKDSFADALESALFDFKNFGSATGGILEGIARNIARARIIDPLSNSLGGLFDSLIPSFGGFFAAGGSPPVGRPSIVGERGPEIFVPNAAGRIVPNHALGGQNVTVINHWNISPGVQGAVRKEILEAAPAIVNQSVAATMQAIQRGGAERRIVSGG